MANHGKIGADLAEYLERKRQPHKAELVDPKTRIRKKKMVEGRYEKPSYLNRAEERKKRLKKSA